MDEASEKALVEDTLRGDTRSFERLVEKYQRPLFNVAYRMLNDPEDSLDVTQTAFLKAYDKLGTYDSRYRFFSWIYRILVNESLHLIDRRRTAVPVPEELPSRSPAPDDACHGNETARAVQNALQQLTTDYRTVIVLRYWGEMSHREIAEVLDVPEKTVKSRLFTARRRLSELLGTRGEDG